MQDTSLPPSNNLRTDFSGPGDFSGLAGDQRSESAAGDGGWRGRGWEAEAGWRPGPGRSEARLRMWAGPAGADQQREMRRF